MYKPWAFNEEEKATIIPVTIGTKKILLIMLVFLFVESKAQTIPSSRTFDWSQAGYEGIIPDSSGVFDVNRER